MANLIKLDSDTADTLDCAPGDEVTLTCTVKVTKNDESGFEGEPVDIECEPMTEDTTEEDDSESESESGDAMPAMKGKKPDLMIILGKGKK